MYSDNSDNSISDDDSIVTVNNDELEFESFQFIDYKSQTRTNDIDPDNNIFNNMSNNCTYYTDTIFNETVNVEGKISLIHFNSRSLYSNFECIKDYLGLFKTPFRIIAFSET